MDVEAEQIDARVVARVETWLDQTHFRSDNQVNILLSCLSFYCVRGLVVQDNKPLLFPNFPLSR
jgi:hypothetical protein